MNPSKILSDDHRSLALLQSDLLLALNESDLARTFQLLDLFWARLAIHIRAENVCLFPAIINAASTDPVDRGDVPTKEEVSAAIAGLKMDHNFFMDQLAKAVATMRELVANPDDVDDQLPLVLTRIRDVSARLISHDEIEERVVYEWPARLLNATDLSNLTLAVTQEIENIPPRFDNAS